MEHMSHNELHKHENNGQAPSYTPLILIVIIAIALALIQAIAGISFNLHDFMRFAMGYYLIFLALMKIIKLQDFAALFKTYDLFAKYIPGYALAYPIIELLLGAYLLNNIFPLAINMVLILIMTSTLIGVIDIVRKGSIISCACLGVVLNVPLGKVSITESVAMILMAMLNLYMLI